MHNDGAGSIRPSWQLRNLINALSRPAYSIHAGHRDIRGFNHVFGEKGKKESRASREQLAARPTAASKRTGVALSVLVAPRKLRVG